MSRVSLLAAGCLAIVCQACGAEGIPPTNVILIISDDQGAADYGFMGHPHIRTPNLDKLASQSLVFEQGFVPMSLCCPSLASIITGLYPHQHGITSNDPPAVPGDSQGARGSSAENVARWNASLENIPTLPRILGKRGYLSFQTGKWWHGDYSRGGFTHGMTTGTRHGDLGLKIGREGLLPIAEFLDQAANQHKPFFVWYAPFMPHTPHTPPDRILEKYLATAPSLHVARYWAMCEWFDETCGELLGMLDSRDLAKNTLVLYVTDNGWIQSPDRAAFAPKNKTTPYDLGHRTPIMIRWPNRIAPNRVQHLAASIDLAPTILSSLGISKEPAMKGVNLLDAREVGERRVVVGECFTVRSQALNDPARNLLWRWITDGRWRMILPRTGEASANMQNIPSDRFLTPELIATLEAGRPLLFDLKTDPHEEKNLASNFPEKISELRRELDAVWQPTKVLP